MLSELTVLAVDDEPANQRAVRRTLADDCRVLTASCGDEALALMACEPIALVITDHRMPGMTGTEFLAETVARHPAVIRVVLTGYPEVDTLLDAINRGHVYHFLGKPWEARELRQVVRHGLERFQAVAERARLLDDLQIACARAEREAAQKSRLLALTAHELGTPLHILINALALLREGELGQAALDWIDTAERATAWLIQGVTQLHDAARIGAQRIPLRLERLDLVPLCVAAVAELRNGAAARRLDIGFEADAAPLPIRADARWLRQALGALLSNAVRFTPDGGAIRVSAGADEGCAVVVVADTGIGIAPQHCAELFEPFSSAGGDVLLHGSGRLAFGARGLGLGLAMTKQIIEAHAGTIGVQSTPGEGSCFTLRLPRAE